MILIGMFLSDGWEALPAPVRQMVTGPLRLYDFRGSHPSPRLLVSVHLVTDSALHT